MPVVSNFTPTRDLMKFTDLPAIGVVGAVYTIGWRILDDQSELWSKRFLKFKDGIEAQNAGRALSYALVDALADVGAKPSGRIAVATAMSSWATTFDPKSPLGIAGDIAAKAAGLTWLPGIYAKQVHKSLHTLPSGPARDEEVKDKYTCTGIQHCDGLVILDDLVTRGATLGEMARALHAKSAGIPVIGVALGKNERRDFAKNYNVTVDNSSLAATWECRWNGK